MADTGDNLGDLTVNVTGDFSELQSAIDQSVTVAQSGSEAIASALQGVSDASGLVGRDLEIFQQLLQADADAGVALQQSLEDLSNSAGTLGDQIASGAAAALEQLQEAAESAGQTATGAAIAWDDLATAGQYVTDTAAEIPSTLDNVAASESEVAQNATEAEGGIRGMAEGFLAVGEALAITEGLKDFIEEAINVYGAVQNIATSLQILGESSDEAEQTISGWSDLANTLAVPLETLEQSARRLTVAFQGIEGVDISAILTAAADSAAETGRSFDTVSTALQRIEVTGQVTARQLQSLGVTWQQLADTAGTSVTEVQALLKKGAQDATADLNLVVDTIETVMPGAAQAVAQNVTGQITVLKNLVTETFEAIGQDIAPVVTIVIQDLQSIVQEAHAVATAFQELPPDLQQGIVVAGLLAAALVPIAATLGAIGLAVSGLTTLMGALGFATTAEAAAEVTATEATAAHGAAALVAAGSVEALAAAEGEAATAVAVQMGLFGEETVILGTAGKQMSLFAEGSTAAAAETGILSTALGTSAALLGTAAAGAVILTGQYKTLQSASASTSDSFGILFDWLGKVTGASGTTNTSLAQMSGTTLPSLSEALANSGLGWNTLWTAVKAGTGPIGAIGEAWDSAKDDINTAVGFITGKFSDMETAMKNVATASQDWANQVSSDVAKSVTSLTTSAAQTSATEQALAAQQVKLQGAVTQAAAAVADYSQKLKDNASATQGGIAVSTLLAAAQVKLQSAQDALNKSLGVTKTNVDAIQDPITTFMANEGKLADKVTDAGKQVDWLNGLLAQGVTSVNGISIAMNLLPAALDNVSKAAKASGQALVTYLQTLNQANPAVLTFENILGGIPKAAQPAGYAITGVGQAAMDASGYFDRLGPVIANIDTVMVGVGNTARSVVVPGLEAVKQAAADVASSGDDTISVLGRVAGQAKDVAVPAWVDYKDAVQTAGTADTSQLGPMASVAQALGDEAKALDTDTTAIIVNGKAAADADTQKQLAANAAVVLANKIQLENIAWANGQIVVQNYNSATASIIDTSNSAAGATDAMTQALQNSKQVLSDLIGTDEDYANSLKDVASAATSAGNAIKGLSGGGGGGAGGGGGGEGAQLQGMEDLGSTALVSVQTLDPFLSQFTNPGSAAPGNPNESLAGYSPENLLQSIANETNQAVQSIYGTFVPAAQSAAAALAAVQAEANASGKTLIDTFNGVQTLVTPQLTIQQQAAQANSAATTANTAATTTNTTATASATAATITQTQAQTNLAAAVTQYQTDLASGSATAQQLTLDLANVGSAEQALTTATNDTTAATVASTAATTAAATAMSNAVDAQTALASAQNDLSTAISDGTATMGEFGSSLNLAASQADQAFYNAQAAVNALASSADGAAAAVGQMTTTMGSGMSQFTTSLQNAINQGFNIAPPPTLTPGGTSQIPTLTPQQQALLTALSNPTASALSGTSHTLNGQYVNPNPDLMASPTGNAYGAYSGSGGGVNLNVYVTGNSVTSAALVDQLANKVSNVIVTNLRTNVGLKN